MNKTMRQDVSNALRQRVGSVMGDFAGRVSNSSFDTLSPADLEAQTVQLEADMGRFAQMFKYMRRDKFDEAYNVLETIGKPPEGSEPVEEPPTAPTPETPIVGG